MRRRGLPAPAAEAGGRARAQERPAAPGKCRVATASTWRPLRVRLRAEHQPPKPSRTKVPAARTLRRKRSREPQILPWRRQRVFRRRGLRRRRGAGRAQNGLILAPTPLRGGAAEEVGDRPPFAPTASSDPWRLRGEEGQGGVGTSHSYISNLVIAIFYKF